MRSSMHLTKAPFPPFLYVYSLVLHVLQNIVIVFVGIFFRAFLPALISVPKCLLNTRINMRNYHWIDEESVYLVCADVDTDGLLLITTALVCSTILFSKLVLSFLLWRILCRTLLANFSTLAISSVSMLSSTPRHCGLIFI